MPIHKHPLSYYQTMATLLGGNYDKHDHTIMLQINSKDYLYDRYIDPDTAEVVIVPALGIDNSAWEERKQKYYWWTYPPEPEDSDADAPSPKE